MSTSIPAVKLIFNRGYRLNPSSSLISPISAQVLGSATQSGMGRATRTPRFLHVVVHRERIGWERTDIRIGEIESHDRSGRREPAEAKKQTEERNQECRGVLRITGVLRYGMLPPSSTSLRRDHTF